MLARMLCSRRWASSSRTRHDCAVEGLARLLVDDDAPAALSTAAAPEFVHGGILALPELEVSHAYVASSVRPPHAGKLGRARRVPSRLRRYDSHESEMGGRRRAATS